MKCIISFSPNVGSKDKRHFQNILGVENSQPLDMYLGLPTIVGRNKKKVFEDIKDWVWKKVQQWRHSFFLWGGLEVLIKAVLQAILSYVMCVFRVPNSLCNKLKSIML